MEVIITDERDERFIELSDKLNQEYYDIHGEMVLKYNDYNELNVPHLVLLVLNWDKLIACVAYRKFNDNSIEIKRLFVSKRHRKKGIAHKIVKQIEKIAIDYGFKYSYIVTGINNTAAINLYVKMDYKVIDNFGMFEDDEDCLCMKKEFKSLL